MTRFSPFSDSLWYATAIPASPWPELTQDIDSEVCVVGGGYTGLTTALALARRGVSVSLLEAEEIGFGGSGRNAGHCTPTFTQYSLPALRRMLGDPWATRLIDRQTKANRTVSHLVERYAIACDWIQNGYVMGALMHGQLATLRQKQRDYNAVGAETAMLSAEAIAEKTGSERFAGGWYHPEGGHLQPLSYARGLAKAAASEGASIHVRSPVTACEAIPDGWRVRTSMGSVRARKVVFATGAYTVGGWPGLERSFRIMRVFVAATEPLADSLRRQVLPANTTMHDGRGDIFVYKYDRDGRLVVSMFPMGRRGADQAYTIRLLTDRLRWLHPAIPSSLGWEHLWFGELDMQRRTIPRLYELAPGVVALTGLSGRGVPTGTMLGEVLAEWATDVPEGDLALPIEPLVAAPSYMAVAPSAMLRYYRIRDWVRARTGGHALPPHA